MPEHPSLVDPSVPGLTRIQRFRAEMVRAVYESEGTSEAEMLMGDQIPSVVSRAFADAGWADSSGDFEMATATPAPAAPRGAVRALPVRAAGSSVTPSPPRKWLQGRANVALAAPLCDDARELDEPGRGGAGGVGGADSPGGGSSGSPGSGSSSLGKRLRELSWRDEPRAVGDTGGGGGGRKERGVERGKGSQGKHKSSKDKKKKKATPSSSVTDEEGAPPKKERRGRPKGSTTVGPASGRGRYYEVRNKYICNNCGDRGHTRGRCEAPPRLLDAALEALGWQVTEIVRKGDAPPPQRSLSGGL